MPLADVYAAIQLVEGVPAAFVALKSMFSPRQRELLAAATPRDVRPEAVGTYIAFQAAATEFLFSVGFIVQLGVPPKASGALWTWPAVFRAHRSAHDAALRLASSFGQMVMVGSVDVTTAAFEVCEALAAVSGSMEVRRRRLTTSPNFEEKHANASVALRQYLLAVRTELSLGPAIGTSEATEAV